MNPILKCFLAMAFILPSAVQAKPCGRGYIADNKACHKGGGASFYIPARTEPAAPKVKPAPKVKLARLKGGDEVLHLSGWLYRPGCPNYDLARTVPHSVTITFAEVKTTYPTASWSDGCKP